MMPKQIVGRCKTRKIERKRGQTESQRAERVKCKGGQRKKEVPGILSGKEKGSHRWGGRGREKRVSGGVT